MRYRFSLVLLVVFPLFVLAPPSVAESRAVTRIEVVTPSGNPVDCADGVVNGVGNVIVRGYATALRDVVPRFRFDYKPPDGLGGWYPVYTQLVSAGDEVLLTEISHDLSPGSGTHVISWGEVGAADHDCRFTATNLPAASEGVKTTRVPAADPLDAFKLTILRYSDNGLIGSCTSGQPNPVHVLTGGRVKLTVEARNGSSGYHVLHTHQETGPRLSPIGPDQDGDGVDRRWWEQAAYGIYVPGDGVWTQLNDQVAARIDGRVTFHTTDGSGLEVFCKAIKAP